MAVSWNNRYLVYALASGSIIVFEMKKNNSVMIRAYTKSDSRTEFVKLEFSYDSFQLLAVTNGGEAYIFCMKPV